MVIAILTPVFFAECNILNKCLDVIILGDDQLQIDPAGIFLKGLLALEAFPIWMYIAAVEKAHYVMAVFPQLFDGIDAARCTADVNQYFHRRAPKRAVPMRTRVAPS